MNTSAQKDQLKAVVALWLTNGNKGVEPGNETRWDLLAGDWHEAIDATENLVNSSYLTFEPSLVPDPRPWESGDLVYPTAQGIFEALR